MQQLEAILFTQLNEAIDQFFLQTVKLVAALRLVTGVKLIFQPDPLKERRLV